MALETKGRVSEHFQVLESDGPPSATLLERFRGEGWRMIQTTQVAIQSPITQQTSVRWITHLERVDDLPRIIPEAS